ncbi:M14 metallopeptidase family protein [Flavobacterium sp. NRK1]|uniref:M14 family metallopeptidase n=1 Tax=Flavobacterium sp. NRK1 TaxID=2954929 RepID=UPI002093D485|nr:M14 metallopeptidase family protein [Flavobacterium sp. NRK1]MCO6149475.1 M14 family metallopeptidase [Flavobacterium sp. NRK1]
MDLRQIFIDNKEERLYGRYITNNHIEPVLNELKKVFAVSVIGTSVLHEPIYSVKAGSGKIKIYMWSQMHGNESTTTKAIFDFLNFLKGDNEFAVRLKATFTFLIIPILNPDGAKLYTRENAFKVDLNRDSVNLSQPESKLLRNIFEEFKPDYCYNMHDQRTIFGVGDIPKPATVSFLAPSYNNERDINNTRLKAINVIAAMNETLQQFIPGQVGRFDDSFNINCIGDMFQSLNVPTILFEAGHFQDDYEREQTRKFIFFALLSGFNAIYENVIVVNKKEEYFNIPQNKIIFYDIMYKNVKINYENKEKITNFASQYKEVLFENSVIFRAIISEIGNLEGLHAHKEFDAFGAEFLDDELNKMPIIGNEADFSVDLNRKFVNGVEIE